MRARDMDKEPVIVPAKKLSQEQLAVLRKKATEPAFSGKLLHETRAGTFECAYCGNKIFESGAKFDSGTGWPSFCEAIPGSVRLEEDNSHFMKRIEARCAKCGSHLGHVFSDGPAPGKKRFCINSLAMDFYAKK